LEPDLLLALGCLFKWEEKALTRTEYFRRVELRNKVYAPVVWLKRRDASGVVNAFIQWEYKLCHKDSFDASRLP